jgi:hypothetical protein
MSKPDEVEWFSFRESGRLVTVRRNKPFARVVVRCGRCAARRYDMRPPVLCILTRLFDDDLFLVTYLKRRSAVKRELQRGAFETKGTGWIPRSRV